MPYPIVFFIHSATIRHATGATTEDQWGNVAPVTADTTTVCRFSKQDEQFEIAGQSAYLTTVPKIALPPATTISENDQIISTVQGYSDTFRVNEVRVVYEGSREVISHITCKLAAVA
jgi:hypothetical protein